RPLLPSLLRHPPRPTLFPYTTLFRSRRRLRRQVRPMGLDDPPGEVEPQPDPGDPPAGPVAPPPELLEDARQVVAVDSVALVGDLDRKSTRLNSSHRTISYAVFCLKKK